MAFVAYLLGVSVLAFAGPVLGRPAATPTGPDRAGRQNNLHFASFRFDRFKQFQRPIDCFRCQPIDFLRREKVDTLTGRQIKRIPFATAIHFSRTTDINTRHRLIITDYFAVRRSHHDI